MKKKEPTSAPSTAPTETAAAGEQVPPKAEMPPTTLGYPCRYRVADMPNAPQILLAGHRQPQMLEIHFAWFILENLAIQFVRGAISVPREPEGIFTLRLPAIKLRSEEVISIDDPGAAPVLFTPGGMKIGPPPGKR